VGKAEKNGGLRQRETFPEYLLNRIVYGEALMPVDNSDPTLATGRLPNNPTVHTLMIKTGNR
jgi:hypothetical protein